MLWVGPSTSQKPFQIGQIGLTLPYLLSMSFVEALEEATAEEALDEFLDEAAAEEALAACAPQNDADLGVSTQKKKWKA